jgi:hypothetical protein
VIEAYRRTGRLDGACLCGAVRVRVDGGYVAAVGVCHCSMCQRWNGMIYGTFDAEADAVTVEGEVARYPATPFSERAFCAACGSHLWMRNTDGDAANYEFPPGLFPAARDFPLISEIYIDRAPAYAALAGGHRRATRAEYEAKNPHLEGDMP